MIDKNTMEQLDLGMSNEDHSIDPGLEEALRDKPSKVLGTYIGWNFYGYVWHDADTNQFVCQVWTYNSTSKFRPKEEVTADSLEEIMELVSEEYGYGTE